MAVTASGLKTRLAEIRDADYRIGEGRDYFALALEMAVHIGSPDHELRDDLIYDIFAHWIEADLLDVGQLKQLLDVSLDDSHLFYRIGESGTDSVFTRSFSSLVIALIIDAHRRHAFLASGELHRVMDEIEDYLGRERDVRGYVDGKGWAHSVAHAADVLAGLAQCPELSAPADLREILAVVKMKVETDYYTYIHEEDERLVTVVVRVLDCKVLDDREIVQWLDSFQATKSVVRYPGDLYLRANVKSFFRSLYFRLSKIDGMAPVTGSLLEMMGRHSRF
jgi:hypothetical protein